jgi:tetratricopeptide (TPR) repeat protein
VSLVYLKNTNASFDDYIRITERTTENFEKIQSKLLEESINYSKTRYGIITSTFEEVIRQNKNFGELLFFVCLLDSQGIPKKLLKNVCDSVLVDNFIYNLRKHSLIAYDDDKISIHRSTQNMGLSYLMDSIASDEKRSLIKKLISKITPYEYLDANYDDLAKLIPHLKAFLNKIDRLFAADSSMDCCKIDLLLTVGDIYRLKEYLASESLVYFDNALKINESRRYLDKTEVALINLKIGGVYTLMSKNDDAMKYLFRCFEDLEDGDHPAELARNHRLIGVINMRKNLFNESNACFEKAITILDQAKEDNLELKIVRANTYSDMAFNYFMNGINRGNANKSVDIMKKAIDTLTKNNGSNEKITRHLVNYKSRLSGIYNALGKYDLSLKEGREAENLIRTLPSLDNGMFCARGIILREKALSHLRLNKVKEAYDYFMQAKEVFSKAMIFDYLFRLKMHEAEALIRLNRLDEASKACEEIFAIENRERNNYGIV